MQKEQLEKEILEEENKLIAGLNNYILVANVYINNPNQTETIKLHKGMFYVGNSEGLYIENSFSQDEILILAYEASQKLHSYESYILELIFDTRKIVDKEGSIEKAIEALQEEIDELKQSGYEIIERKKGYIERKKEQFQMLKDKETRADGLAYLLGILIDDNIKKEKVKVKLPREKQKKLERLYETQNLLNGETRKFVANKLKDSILIREKIKNSGVKTQGINQKGLEEKE